MDGYTNFRLLAFLFVSRLGFLEASVSIPELAQDLKLENQDGLTNAKINEIFDDVMPMIKDLIIKSGLDPLKMDDMQEELHGILGKSGVLKLQSGWMQGLSATKRSGDVLMSYENKIVTLDALLGLDFIDVSYDYGFKYWIISRKGALHARLHDAQLRVLLKVDLEHYRIRLESLQATSVRKIEVELEGGVVDKILSAAINAFAGLFKKRVIEMIEHKGSEVVTELLNKINEKIPRPDGTQLMELEDNNMVRNSNVWDNSVMIDNIPIFIKFMIV